MKKLVIGIWNVIKAIGRGILWVILLPWRMIQATARGINWAIRQRWIQASFAALVLLVGIGVFLDRGPFFRVANVIVEGKNEVAADEWVNVSGIHVGEPLVRLRPWTILSRLRSDLRVENAEMTYEFPGTIHLVVRQKSAEWLVSNGKLWGLSSRGDLVPINGAAPPLPLITGLEDSLTWVPYCRLESQRVRYALRFVHEVTAKHPDFWAQVSEVHVSDPSNIRVVLNPSGTVVSLGYGEWDTKVDRLLAAIPMLRDRHVVPAFLDARICDQLLITPKGVRS
jgi:cell division septal protein FtsQ